MSRLFVIGNGFDLHFGVNTTPKDFEESLKTKSIYNESDNALDYFRCYGVDWSEYEQSMANIEFEELEEEHEQAPDYMSDYERDRYSVILDMEMLFDSLPIMSSPKLRFLGIPLTGYLKK